MNEDPDNLETKADDEKAPLPLNEALLQDTIGRLIARGETSRKFECMSLPTPLFNDLVRRLLDRTAQVNDTADWLQGECGARSLDAPARSSVYRFSALVREEFELARIASSRQSSQSIVAALTEGDPEARVMALNNHYTERLTDKLLDLDELDPKQMAAISDALRTVMQGTFGPKLVTARVDALRKQIEERDRAIALKTSANLILQQKLQQIPDKVAAVEKKLRGMQEAVRRGETIMPEIYEAIFAELTAIKTAPVLTSTTENTESAEKMGGGV